MSEHTHELVCIVCPIGCRLTVVKDDQMAEGYHIEGNVCQRGQAYAIKELTSPTRMVPSTVIIHGALLNRLPVKTQAPIPKGLINACMAAINQVEVEAPIKLGDVIIKNLLDTGIDIVATRSMKKV